MSKKQLLSNTNIYCILTSVLITIFALLTHSVRYIVNDDTAMMRIAESFSTNPHSEHLVFMNVLYGYLLKFLYHTVPFANWFLILELFVLNVGFIALYKLVTKLQSNGIAFAAVAAIELFVLSNFTFTAISFIGTLAGMLWLFTYVDKLNKSTVIHCVIAFSLLTMSFAIRSGNTYFFIILLFIPFYFFSFIKKRNTIPAIAVILALCTIANYLMVAANRTYTAHLPDELYFKQFQEYRAKANDGGLFIYKGHEEAFQNVGISANDFELLSHWTYGDKKVFTADVMKTLATGRTFDEKYDTNPLHIIQNLMKQRDLFVLVLLYTFLALLLFIILSRNRSEIVFSFIFTAGAVGYLFFRRRGLARVANPIIMCGILLLLYIFLVNKNNVIPPMQRLLKNTKIRGLVAVVCVLLVICSFVACKLYGMQADRFVNDVQPVAEYIQDDKSHTYLTDVYVFDKYKMNYQNTKIMQPYVDREMPYYSLLGGWTYYSYYYYDNLEKLGLAQYSNSVMTALLDDNVLFVTNYFDPDTFVTFFDENYGYDVAYTVVKEFPDQNVVIYNFFKK